jgi:hypothetical protein
MAESTTTSSLINIYSLPKRKSKREQNRLQHYERILKKCHHRIKYTADTSSSGDRYTFFQIPAFIPGMPMYDIASCIDYIINKLNMNGFKVLSLGTHLLFISWQHIQFSQEREKQMERKIAELSGNLTDLPVLCDAPPPQGPVRNTFRPVYETPSTEKYLML